jgi:hypothetical protein
MLRKADSSTSIGDDDDDDDDGAVTPRTDATLPEDDNPVEWVFVENLASPSASITATRNKARCSSFEPKNGVEDV